MNFDLSVDPNMDAYRERVESARSILGDFTDASDLVTSIPPDVLIAPLTLSTENIAPFPPNYVAFLRPGSAGVACPTYRACLCRPQSGA